MQASEVGGRGQWLSGIMLDLNSRGRKCTPQRWGHNDSVVECLTQAEGPGSSLTSVTALCP